MAKSRPGLTFSTGRTPPPKTAENAESERVFISARVPIPTFRQFKSFAAESGRKVQDLLEEAMTEYLANHRH
jgi:hypothetical protein